MNFPDDGLLRRLLRRPLVGWSLACRFGGRFIAIVKKHVVNYRWQTFFSGKTHGFFTFLRFSLQFPFGSVFVSIFSYDISFVSSFVILLRVLL